MHITDKKIYNETKIFFQNKIVKILLISLICTIITILINYLLSPSINQIFILKNNETLDYKSVFERIKEMNLEQHKIILNIAIAGTISSLFGNVLFINSILTLNIIKFSKKNNFFFEKLKYFFLQTCKLFFLMFFITVLIEFGFMIFILPGIILMFIFALSPIILFVEKINIFNSIINSIKLSFNNIKLILPIITIWIFFKAFLVFFISCIYKTISANITFFLFNLLNYIFLSILVTYLTKLYFSLK